MPSLHPVRRRRARARLLAVALGAAPSLSALAQGVATEAQLAPVAISGRAERSGLAPDLPSNSASKTAGDLREQNLVNPEDALKYLPNTSIRKRYIGDRNALVGGRSFGTLQPSRALVYVDGTLISNFLGRFDAPRWHLVTPEAIERVDMLYGPFSALYPGNSIGTTVAITERVPRAFEASARLTGFRQRYSEYGLADHYDGGQLSAHLGSRLDSGLWYAVGFNHQEATSQPMQYQTAVADANGRFAVPTLPAGVVPTRVDGIRYDTDPKGLRRAVFGASSGAIEHTRQVAAKLRLGYAFTRDLEATAMLGGWANHARTRNASFLRDASGDTVWSGPVTDGENVFVLPATAFAPTRREEAHRHGSFTLKTTRPQGWNGSLVYTAYRIADDSAYQALQPEPQAETGGAGTVTRRDGTGWRTFELQAAYKPVAGDWGDGRHALVLGLHRNAYVLRSPTLAVPDWRLDRDGTLTQRYDGRTEVTALYAQDAWALREDLKLTLGWREERFKAFDGFQALYGVASCEAADGFVCTPADGAGFDKTQRYPGRRLRGSSPKASLAWDASEAWRLKASVGRGVRFPNVEELYNATLNASSQSVSDPALRAERANAIELSAEHDTARQHWRVSLFHDDVRDAILRQSELTASGATLTRVSNVDRVRTHGVELVWQAQDVGLHGLRFDANAAFARSRVVENARDPASEGKQWLRVPKVRANLLASYRPDARWMTSVGVRHSGRAYNDVYNADTNPDVYGGVSSFTFVDLRASHAFSRRLELAIGVDNATDARAYQSHPYPGRTLFTELRASY
jgi:iron complex outermembrane receptor protein